MAVYCVKKADSLYGSLEVQGSKNAVLPMIAACVLHKGTTVLHGCPDISDVRHMCLLLEEVGCRTRFYNGSLTVDAGCIDKTVVGREETRKMRSSIILAGAMLGRKHEVVISYPGGCLLGNRPIDMHLEAFTKLGVRVEESEECLRCHGDSMEGNSVTLRFPSVGATENTILAAVLTKGTTRIYNAAREPEIVSLCHMLNSMGARITGVGSRTVAIEGVAELRDTEIQVPKDRIVTGTYLCAVAGCGGSVTLKTDCARDLLGLYPLLEQLGCRLSCTDSYIKIEKQKDGAAEGGVVQFTTGVFPEFPTDLQPQLMAVLCRRKGHGIIVENIFDNRFAQVEELRKMGAEIYVIDNIAVVNGRARLKGCDVKAYDLRGGAAMVIAGMMAEGESRVHQVAYIERGYEDICRDFGLLGADIQRVE